MGKGRISLNRTGNGLPRFHNRQTFGGSRWLLKNSSAGFGFLREKTSGLAVSSESSIRFDQKSPSSHTRSCVRLHGSEALVGAAVAVAIVDLDAAPTTVAAIRFSAVRRGISLVMVGESRREDMRLRRGPRRGGLAGPAVPDDVAVIGVHNDVLLCELCDPPLTSVIPDAPRAGYVAAELLARKMKGRRLAVRLHEIAPLGVAARQSTDVGAVGDPKIAGAVRFMRQQAAGGANVGDVLRAVPMARTALERRFKAALGTPPHEHLRKLRIERVKDLLARTSLPVGEIATATGFEHPEYLSAMFRRECGVTPREFRARFGRQPPLASG